MLLKSFVQWWNDNPYITFAIGIIGIISFILGIVFYFRSRVRKRIAYAVRTVPIAWRTRYNMNVSKLKFLYDNIEVDTLFSSKVAIWNSGQLTIDNKDVITEFPLIVELDKENKFYEAMITKFSHPANKFVLENLSEKKYKVVFEYIDPGEGCVITLFHSGGQPKITGVVKGLEKISLNKRLKIPKDIDDDYSQYY